MDAQLHICDPGVISWGEGERHFPLSSSVTRIRGARSWVGSKAMAIDGLEVRKARLKTIGNLTHWNMCHVCQRDEQVLTYFLCAKLQLHHKTIGPPRTRGTLFVDIQDVIAWWAGRACWGVSESNNDSPGQALPIIKGGRHLSQECCITHWVLSIDNIPSIIPIPSVDLAEPSSG